MGNVGPGWWWNTPTTELRALLGKELLKAKPNKELIEEINKVLADREGK